MRLYSASQLVDRVPLVGKVDASGTTFQEGREVFQNAIILKYLIKTFLES